MLFNRNNNGSEELYEITGTFKASTSFDVIRHDIEDATSDLRTLIGDVVSLAEDDYQSGTPSELVALVQRAIATKALCYFAKNTGLSHGETGRKLKVDENEKIPFEWMVDRDDRELMERHYRALDRLFVFLEKSDISEWDTSPSGIFRKKLILKDFAEFEAVYPCQSRYSFYKLMPLMLEAQKQLSIRLGVQPDVLAGNPATNRYIVLVALATALDRWSLSIFPLEVSRLFAPSYQGNKETQPATLEEINRSKMNFEKSARTAYSELAATFNVSQPDSFLPKGNPRHKFYSV